MNSPVPSLALEAAADDGVALRRQRIIPHQRHRGGLERDRRQRIGRGEREQCRRPVRALGIEANAIEHQKGAPRRGAERELRPHAPDREIEPRACPAGAQPVEIDYVRLHRWRQDQVRSQRRAGDEADHQERRLVARPTASSQARPSVDIAALVEEERNRWP